MKHETHSISRWLAMALCLIALAVLPACGDHDEPRGEEVDVPEPPDPADMPAPRTVLVYMVATNNLGTSKFDVADLREMEQAAAAGQLGQGRMVVYHASNSGTVLKEVTATGIDTLKVYDDSAPSVSVERMRQVIMDTQVMAPAFTYGLVLWSHASGWLQDGIEEPVTKGYRSYGDDHSKKMSITSLATALQDAYLDYIYFDCCYMGSVEVIYEMRHCAPYMVVSAAEDPADGMPYHLNMANLLDTSKSVEDACITMAKTTFDYYNDVFVKGDCPCTLAVVRSDKVEALADITRQVYQAATTSFNFDYSYQRFKVSGICYYFDLDQYVESICQDPSLMQAWRQALAQAVLYADATPWIWKSVPIERHCGLSTYILSNELAATTGNYNTLSWYTDVASNLFK